MSAFDPKRTSQGPRGNSKLFEFPIPGLRLKARRVGPPGRRTTGSRAEYEMDGVHDSRFTLEAPRAPSQDAKRELMARLSIDARLY